MRTREAHLHGRPSSPCWLRRAWVDLLTGQESTPAARSASARGRPGRARAGRSSRPACSSTSSSPTGWNSRSRTSAVHTGDARRLVGTLTEGAGHRPVPVVHLERVLADLTACRSEPWTVDVVAIPAARDRCSAAPGPGAPSTWARRRPPPSGPRTVQAPGLAVRPPSGTRGAPTPANPAAQCLDIRSRVAQTLTQRRSRHASPCGRGCGADHRITATPGGHMSNSGRRHPPLRT